eukprot:TRINITY_DN22894_c0_g1_i1.p1 TRINITY_DN22894_c0_g1~~TRINITY_DN22894_c0_g1_i1.p1  ORF type:complete len:348 (+),score=53.88 TRINITY_DN22894_c0_g1_i1:45-1046(+)
MGKKSKKPPIKVPPVEKKAGLGGTTFGGFQDTGYIGIDDEYVKTTEVPTRHAGANMTTVPCKLGRTPDVYFDKETRRLDDKFTDPGKSDLEKKTLDTSKKLILSGPWKHPSPAKKSVGAGTYMGTFSEKTPYSHEQETEVIKKGDKPEPPKRQPANISVHFPKTGGFGMTGGGIYFSNPEPPKDSKGDPYEGWRAKEKEERAAAKKRQIGLANGAKPFRSSAKSKQTFDEAEASGISKIYSAEKPLPPLKDKPKEKDRTLSGPFKYTSPPKRGEQGNLNNWTKALEGKPDTYDAKYLKEKEERRKAPKPIGGVWKATSGSKVGCTRSLLKKYY